MKRSPMPPRKKRIRPVNPQQRAKRQARTAKLRRSPEHREAYSKARERSGGQCEYRVRVEGREIRCTEPSTELHHVRYTTPVLMDVCRAHHELIESTLRPWNRNRLGR